MATWQELAVPAVSAIAGVGISASIQLMISARQRRHEAGLHDINERRDAYIKYAYLAHKLHSLTVVAQTVQGEVDRLGPPNMLRRELQQELMKTQGNSHVLEEIERQEALYEAEFNKLRAKADHGKFLAESVVLEDFWVAHATIRVLGPPEVAEAAKELMSSTQAEDNAEFTSCLDAYYTAAHAVIATRTGSK
ncbi:hypothetical protein [Microbispora hainanensis]|uniref:Uncharacterized protein n=1 Tax=Microbispora hainanensis TaxID=568844 RepID=A0ABZ1STD4_9ACTN|nr:hypothetical protein [Microbispora hainanensis]